MHALGNIKEELLIETSHLPMALLAIAASAARWPKFAAPVR